MCLATDIGNCNTIDPCRRAGRDGKNSFFSLKNPQVVGFGVSNAASFHDATVHAKGAIIGSAFINILTEEGLDGISDFIKTIR